MGTLAGRALLLVLLAAAPLSADVIVLKGGTRIELKQPPMQQGNNVLLTRTDGTLFSVPASEVDWKATSAARKSPPKPAPAIVAPPETPAEAARMVREGPRARVKITDADVNHEVVGAEDSKKEGETSTASTSGTAKLEVADYTQEKTGTNLIVRGNLRNVGATSATGVHMSVTALDDAGKGIGSSDASLSKGTLEAGSGAAFTVALPVGDKIVASVRFSPVWTPAPLPAPAGAAPAAAGASAAAPAAAPAMSTTRPAPAGAPTPVPTPYGQGLLYAAPAASAGATPPADGTNGYIPGAARKEDQPKPPQ